MMTGRLIAFCIFLISLWFGLYRRIANEDDGDYE